MSNTIKFVDWEDSTQNLEVTAFKDSIMFSSEEPDFAVEIFKEDVVKLREFIQDWICPDD
mgnify:CR=1 FL=1